jgi:hypothetical protein
MDIQTWKIPRKKHRYRVWFLNGTKREWRCRADTKTEAREMFAEHFGDPKTIVSVENYKT